MTDKRKKRIRELAAKTGLGRRDAANEITSAAATARAVNVDVMPPTLEAKAVPLHPTVVVEAPESPHGPILLLEYVCNAARKLLDRPLQRHSFTTRVSSNNVSVSDEVGPNGKVNMAPMVAVTFAEESSAQWRFDGALAFIDGELYDGQHPVGAERLDTEDGRKRLGEIIVGHIRAEQPWFAEKLAYCRVKSAFRGNNLVAIVSLAFMSDPIDALIAELRPFHMSSIRVGRIPASGRRSIEQVRDLANNPQYYADTAFVKKKITHDELLALVERGATEDSGIQKIRVFNAERQVTFSVPCAKCDGWINCEHDEHSGKCRCGQPYEITFDGEIDWSLPRGRLCIDCGEPHTMALVSEGRSPWQRVNERQQVCNVCSHMSHIGPRWVRKRAAERRAENGKILAQPEGVARTLDPYAGRDAIDPYAALDAIDPYTAADAIDPYAGADAIDPYAALDAFNPTKQGRPRGR